MTGLPNLPIAGGSGGLTPSGRARLPEWFKVRPPGGERYAAIRDALRARGLSTVCEEARCPNLSECWSGGASGHGTATLMVMGDTCTRGCRFCSVATGKPLPLDPEEPRKSSETVGVMGVKYVVLTSVDRDDLPDGGADHFARVIERLKADHPGLLVEVLTPDFQGDEVALRRVLAARPDVIFTSFGDMLRVPGSECDLLQVRARGGQVKVVYSPLDALELARRHPDKQVVFFAVGFETTAPANAMAVWRARELGIANFSVLVSHVLVPPAMEALLSSPANRVQGFLAAGHVELSGRGVPLDGRRRDAAVGRPARRPVR